MDVFIRFVYMYLQVDEYAIKTNSVGPLKSMKMRLDEKSRKLTLMVDVN